MSPPCSTAQPHEDPSLSSSRARTSTQVSGADESSLYVEVKSVSGDDIVCEAKNSAVLAGLLTLVHSRGPAGATAPVDMPLLADADHAALKCARGPFMGCIFMQSRHVVRRRANALPLSEAAAGEDVRS